MCKLTIYRFAEANPDYFTDDAGEINIFDDEYVHRKYLVLRAIKDNVLKKSANNKSMLWYIGGQIILTAPQSVDLVEHFTEFLSTDEGLLVMEEIKKRS